MSFTGLVIIFLYNDVDKLLPKIGIAFLLIAIASNTPSHRMIGVFQLIRFSKKIMSLEA